MDHLLLSNASLDIKTKSETESFQRNKELPQGDSISGILFNVYLEDSLRRARCEFKLKKPEIEDSYSKAEKSRLPKEIYADDTDFSFKTKEEKNNMIETVNAVFPYRNLKINEDKTEHTFLQHGDRNTKTWRNVKKVGSLLGNSEDIIRRKQLAISSMNKLQAVWIRRDYISEEKGLRLYNCLLLLILLYNYST